MPPFPHWSIIILDDDDEPNSSNPSSVLPVKGTPMCTSITAGKILDNPVASNAQKTNSMAHLDNGLSKRPVFIDPDWSSGRNTSASRKQSFAPLSPMTMVPPRHCTSSTNASMLSARVPDAFWAPSNTSKLGTMLAPIEIDGCPNGVCEQLDDFQLAKVEHRFKRSHEAGLTQGHPELQPRRSVIWLDNEDTTREETALVRSMNRTFTENDVLIDLDDIDGFEEFAQDDRIVIRHSSPELELLRVSDVHRGNLVGASISRPSTTKLYDRRNPTIVSPFVPVKKINHSGSFVRVGHTMELHDGDFLQITAILLNNETSVVKLRGQRLHRVRDLNGMLGKKLNELCFFYEVDLDDQRPPEIQSAAEVDLTAVKSPRSLHTTNMPFPLDRSLSFQSFRTMVEASEKGGLTVRWKYTCKYASADERHKNNPSERLLEHVKADDCLTPRTSDATSRAHWRGETIPGGAYQPTIPAERPISIRDFCHQNHISIYSAGMRYEDIIQGFSANENNFSDSERCTDDIRVRKRRNRSSVQTIPSSSFNIGHVSKRTRWDEESESQCFPSMDPDQSGSSLIQHIDLTASSPPSLPQTIDLTSSDPTTPPPSGSILSSTPLLPIKRTPGQKLTYGDAFCGAGGATRGAVLAGLKVEWGFDFWGEACKTWTANFSEGRVYNVFADAFIQQARNAKEQGNPELMKVDILHLSPPCQYFSTAHTVNGVNDEMNTASLFAVEATIEVARPRIVTLEQTFGIAMGKFRYYLNALIMMFTSHGFSVRWSIVQLADWGVPQRRRRLIIIASCPGEILPGMPAATHNEHGTNGLKSYATVNQALQSIPSNAPDHNPDSVLFRSNKPWNGEGILPRTMTTSGGQNYHPSGKRDFTHREFATLQGFPADHLFRGTGVKKQIGNAVPPCVARVLFESIKRDLDEADGIVDGVNNEDVVIID